jgi:hypothetical protein
MGRQPQWEQPASDIHARSKGLHGWSPDGQLIGVLYSEDNKNRTLLIPSHGSGKPQVIMGEQPWWWLSNFWPLWGTYQTVRED